MRYGAPFGHSSGSYIVLALAALPIVCLLPLWLPIALHLRMPFRDGLCRPSRALEALVTGPIRAHDTRSVSTSWALFNGVSVEKIQKAAFWSNPNSFISCYLKDVIVPEASFASASLRASRPPTSRSGSAR